MRYEVQTHEVGFFVVPAPGHYGDKCRVLSNHRSLDSARRAAKMAGGCVVRSGDKRRGDTWLRVYESFYAEVE